MLLKHAICNKWKQVSESNLSVSEQQQHQKYENEVDISDVHKIVI